MKIMSADRRPGRRSFDLACVWPSIDLDEGHYASGAGKIREVHEISQQIDDLAVKLDLACSGFDRPGQGNYDGQENFESPENRSRSVTDWRSCNLA